MDLTKKEIEIILKLRDEASKNIKSFKSTIKEFSKETKDSLSPILQLRRSWMLTSIVIAATAGTFIKVTQEIAKLREEYSKLDIMAIKLNVSSEVLSKKWYGFNIGSYYARIGSEETAIFLDHLKRQVLEIKNAAAEGLGKTYEFAKSRLIYEEKAHQFQRQKILAGTPFETHITNPLAPFGAAKKRLQQEALIEAKKQIQEEIAAFKLSEAEKKGIVAEVQSKIKQLEQSGFQYKETLINQEIDLYREAGVREIDLKKYYSEAIKRLEEDRSMVFKQQSAIRLKAEGQTLEAMKLEQQNAFTEFKRQFGSDGEMVAEFIRGQEATYKAARDNYFGIKSISFIIHDSYLKSMNALEATMGGFYDTTTGSFKTLKEQAVSFGNAIIGIINQMIAQFIVAQAITGITSIFTPKVTHWTPAPAGTSIPPGIMLGHTGGLIPDDLRKWPRAHSGLAVDEIPIIAKRREGILSETGMDTIGGANNLRRINQGRGIGETHIHYHSTVIIKAWDFADIYNNKDTIEGIINESLRKQGSVAKSIKRFT